MEVTGEKVNEKRNGREKKANGNKILMHWKKLDQSGILRWIEMLPQWHKGCSAHQHSCSSLWCCWLCAACCSCLLGPKNKPCSSSKQTKCFHRSYLPYQQHPVYSYTEKFLLDPPAMNIGNSDPFLQYLGQQRLRFLVESFGTKVIPFKRNKC